MPGVPPEFWVPAVHIDRLSIAGATGTAGPPSEDPRIAQRGLRWLFIKGRLADGHTVEEARTQLETLFSRLRTDYAETHENTTSSVVPITSIRFHPMLDGYVRAAGAMLMGAVGLVLLVACANVAGMLLARGTARRRELAIRGAIGAGRSRLLRQLMTENLVLAITGGRSARSSPGGRLASSPGLAPRCCPTAWPSISRRIPGSWRSPVPSTALTTIAAGLAPAWSGSATELVPALKDEVVGTGSRRRITMRDALVVGQLALSLVLLVTGALLGRGLLVAGSTKPGFDADHVAMLSFDLQMNGYDRSRAMAFRDRAVEALRALPGVAAVSPATRVPLSPDINLESVRIEGRHAAGDEPTPIDAARVGADYFDVVGVALVSGRRFSADEEAQNRRVAVVSETAEKQFWPGQSAVGQRIYLDGFERPPVEVIGVSRDHKVRSVGEAPRPYLYLTPERSSRIALVVKTAGPSDAALPALRQAIWALEPDVVFTEDVSAAEVVAATMSPTRIGAWLLGAFGLLALLLSTVGLYGVVAYAVSLRTREVGIRMALGAERGQVLWMMFRQGGRLALAGLVLGAIASAAVGRLIERCSTE